MASNLTLPYNCNVAIFLDSDNLLALSPRWERRRKYLLKFLKSAANCLNAKKIPEESLDKVPSNEDLAKG